ncbi:Protein farnesyltransferase/geranylgeranyltransferase type-1 subunit alpha [Oopsacas minuta]|uniref:Protein farnesyltransferase/geranylgeranyltransferase type-1 subunit alpha n=1 Tax=Oopsacas minuta TaxID=111878 RepID=A0AAV7JNQ7_9METZ|nr:Protein farnesyltransferase/geranylgeranyltransferase type-1 subunit alpha [Oopsacas minuta]
MSDTAEPIPKPIPSPLSSPDSDTELPVEMSPPPPTEYSTDPIWSDVIPIPQHEGPFPVVRIAYTKEFKEVHDYLRAMLKTNEQSDRALSLTEHAVTLNPANYTTWQYRRVLLKAMGCDLEKELDFIASVIGKHPKNYQVWYHRQKLTEWIGSPGKEFEFTADCLEDDTKNYHVWQYRQWLLEKFPSYYKAELEFVDTLIKNDVRNNSAWNQRYFVLTKMSEFTVELVRKEIEYTKLCIRLSLHNESPWNYMRGILNCQDLSLYLEVKIWILQTIAKRKPSIYAYSILIDICEMEIEEGGPEMCQNALTEALSYCQILGEDMDVIRKNYWAYTADRLKNLFTVIHGVNTFHSSLIVTKEISMISKGSFVVIKPIGKGSMGIVYLIKSLNEDSIEGAELFAMKEMDYGYDANGCIQLVQEYCNRGTLYQFVKERRANSEEFLNEKEVLIWSCQLASALVYLHDSKILHRDLKSQNIFLTSDLSDFHTSPLTTVLKLGDFGISRPLEGTYDLASTCIGTPAYMAPEVCHKSLYSYPCDMWSIGCVIVEICSLKPAFQSTSLVAMVFKILNADYTQIPGKYSQSLSAFIDSLFRVEPELRPTAKQAMNILSELLETVSVTKFAESNTLDEYDNDFDSFSDHSSDTNCDISQGMATLSLTLCPDTTKEIVTQTTNENVVKSRGISQQNSDNYSDDFDSYSENEDG